MDTRIKRITAGLLALSMCATAIPLTTFADSTGNTSTVQSAQTMTYTDMLEQLSIIEDCFNAPYFMVSEGDSVYIDGEKVATTTVEVDREMAFSDSKKKYWLDATAFGSYEALEQAAAKINAYLDANKPTVDTAESNLKTAIKAVRDYCVSKKLYEHIGKDTTAYKNLTQHSVNIPYNVKLVVPDDLIKTDDAETSSSVEESIPTYTDLKATVGSNTETEYALIGKLLKAHINADYDNYIAIDAALPSADIYDENGNIDQSKLTYDSLPGHTASKYVNAMMQAITAQASGFDATLKTLFGDATQSSEEWLNERLETLTTEELAYACSVISSNLKIINTYEYQLTNKVWDFYNYDGTVVARMTLPQYFEILAAYDYTVPEMTEDEKKTAEEKAAEEAAKAMLENTIANRLLEELGLESEQDTDTTTTPTVEDASYADAARTLSVVGDLQLSDDIYKQLDVLVAQLGTITYGKYVNVTDNVYSYNRIEYVRSTANYVDAEIEPAGVLKIRNDARDKVILNMPTELVPAWYTFFDVSMGYDAFTEPADPIPYKDAFNERKATVDGEWDFGATRYDAIKYTTEIEEHEGVPTEKKVAITDETGTPKHYARQSEVTPWINWQYLIQCAPSSVEEGTKDAKNNADSRVYEEYATWATHETLRNLDRNNPENTEEWYCPQHPEKYTVKESPDMTAMLREKGYDANGTESFNCTGVRINISRYAMDNYGTDEQDIYTCNLSFADYPQYRYSFDVTAWLEALFYEDASAISSETLQNFATYLAYIKPELTEAEIGMYKNAYLRYLTGFNVHNGYVVTLDYIYECDDIAAIADSDLAQLKGVNKVLLTEIPEYSISEYYEDKTNLLKLTDVQSSVLKPTDRMYKLLNENAGKLYNADSDLYTFASGGSVDWSKMLDKYAVNRSLGYQGTSFTVPVGVSLRLPAYIPVRGRTVDTRFFVKYLPDLGTTPTANNTVYYAVDMTNTIGTGIESFASRTTQGSTAYKTLNLAQDRTGYYTTFYALDRGVKTVSALQRVMSPITQFTVIGNGAENLNNGLTVGTTPSGENGYQDATLGVAVAEQGLPTLVWDTVTGGIINQDTLSEEYSGDVHLWVSKSTSKDGIIVADWVNATPDLFKDTLSSTNTQTGVYNEQSTVTSVEKPSTATAGKAIHIKSGLTKGTFADWAFKRTLTKVNMPYCIGCGKFVADTTHHRALNYTYCRESQTVSQTVEWVLVRTETVKKGSSSGSSANKRSNGSITVPSKYLDSEGNEQTQSSNKPHKDYSDHPFDLKGFNGDGEKIRFESGDALYDALANGAIGKLADGFYIIGGFEVHDGWNQDVQDRVQTMLESGDLHEGDRVSALAKDPVTGEIFKYTVDVVAKPSTSVSEGDDTVTINVYEPRIVTTVGTIYTLIPNVQMICTSDWVYVDVWALNTGSSPYKSDAMVLEGAGAIPTVLKTPGTYGNILYSFTAPSGCEDVFNQVVDVHSSHKPHTTTDRDNVLGTNDNASGTANEPQKKLSSQTQLAQINASAFGVLNVDGANIAAVFEVESLDALYARATRDSPDAATLSTAHKRPINTYRDAMITHIPNWYRYVNELFSNTKEETTDERTEVNETTAGTFAPTAQERLEKAVRVFNISNTGLASVNAIVCPTMGINTKVNETFADVTEKSSNGDKGTVTVKLPDITYVPYIITNNISGVTKTGDALDYTIKGTTKIPRKDIFGVLLDAHEYRTEQYTKQYKTTLIPEVLMTYKDSYLDESGNLMSYENRGALNSLYIAGYNKYALDLPMYNKATLMYDVDADVFETVGAATAKNKAANALSSTLDVLYTGTEVSTIVDTEETPSIDFKSYVLDFANPNIGTAWDTDYTATTAFDQAQAWLNTYKGNNAGNADSFAYTANLNVTYSTSQMYAQTSNAANSTATSTVTVDGVQQKPIEVSQEYTFDLKNKDDVENTYALIAKYPVTIRNGRLATITVDGHTYVMYGDGNITTTAQLMENQNFKKLREEHLDVAEAVANMQLPEFAKTLTHNGGSQTWNTYKDTSMYTDNTKKTVPDEVGEERAAYDANYANADGWYSEDTTVLEIKLYGISGDIDNHYAFSYKVPLDYGYKSPRNKSDLFKAGTALYAYNEMYFRFENTAKTTTDDATVVSGTYDIVGEEGANNLVNTPKAAYIISNATVNDMTR